ncbi:MAG: efflux RND transporter periplasmic adaptor subunit [Pseudomonadota bacterium]
MSSICRIHAVLLSALIAGSPAVAQSTDLTPSGDPAPIPAVRLVAPIQPERGARAFFGRVAALDTVPKAFEVGGQIIEIDIREGARIAAGDVIARLDPEPLQRALERAELDLARAERDYDRARTLAERNVASDVAADDALTERDLAEVALRDARAALEDAVIVSPFDGIVAERLVAPFTLIEAGQPVLALHDLSEVRIEVEMPERVLIRAGGPEAIDFAMQNETGADIPVELAEYEARTDGVGQTFTLSLRVPPDAGNGLLIPGASKTVLARLPLRDVGALLPPGAILANTKRGFEVMVFEPTEDDRGTVVRREVNVQAPMGTGLRVEGLPDDVMIVAAGGHLLRDGQEVRVYDGLVVEEE